MYIYTVYSTFCLTLSESYSKRTLSFFMQMKAYKMFFNLALGRIENVYKRQIDMRPNISETFIEKKDKPF